MPLFHHAGRRGAALALAMSLIACAPDAEPTRAAADGAAASDTRLTGSAYERGAVTAGLTDAITRIAPTLGGEAPRNPVATALEDVRAALEIGDAPPLTDAIARARRVLDEQVPPASGVADPSRAADAAVVRLALDRAASLVTSAIPTGAGPAARR